MIVAVLNLKGGCGKSTLATNFARSMQRLGHGVLLVDLDGQGTLAHWQARQARDSDQPPVVLLEPARVAEALGPLAMAHDVVVVDGAAKVMQGLGHLVRLADLVLIPVQPSGADLWAVAGLAEMIRTRQRMHRGQPRAAFVLTRQIDGTRLVAGVRRTLEAFEIPVLEGRLAQRVVYAEALARGQTVLDLAPGSKAAREVEALRDEVLTRFEALYRDTRVLQGLRGKVRQVGRQTDHGPEPAAGMTVLRRLFPRRKA